MGPLKVICEKKTIFRNTYFYDTLYLLWISEILRDHVLPFLQARPGRDRIVFQQDGARLEYIQMWIF